MKKILIIVLAILVIGGVAWALMLGSNSDDQPNTAENTERVMPLYAYTWTWQESRFNGGSTTVPQDPSQFTLQFDADAGSFSSTTDCNNVMGNIMTGDGSLEFSSMAMTKMACPDGTLEQEYVDTLDVVNGYEIYSEDELTVLSLKQENGEMIFYGTAR